MSVALTIAHTCPDDVLVVYGTTDRYAGPDGGPAPIHGFGDAKAVELLNHADAQTYFLRILTAVEAELDLRPIALLR